MSLHRACLQAPALAGTVAALTILAGGNAAAVSNVPLSVVTGVPPNLLFILDDSGSMTWDFMVNPDIGSVSGGGLADPQNSDCAQVTCIGSSGQYNNSNGNTPADDRTNVYGRNYATNTLMYNPNKDYLTWVSSSGTRMTGGTSYAAAYTNNNNLSDTSDLGDRIRTFYVPKSSATNLADITNYYRYQIHTDDRIVRSERSNNGSEGESGRGCTGGGSSWAWRNCTYATPTGRSEAAELANYATWHSYHRTRMKVAKAGASEAFNELGNNVRVGFRGLGNNNTENPPLDIPVNNGNQGLFTGTARSTWFSRLQSTIGESGTPLRGALQGAGQYFSSTNDSGPYGPESQSSQWACRQNFTILTTDGYWNGNNGLDIENQDGTDGPTINGPESATYTYSAAAPYQDSNSNTLADVAMKYWKTDLRTDLENIVAKTNADPAFWQHMVTFGISIGLKGTLDQSSVEQVLADGSPRDNGANVSWPEPSSDNIKNIDDLLHAAVNGHGTFVSAGNPDEFREGLQSALRNIVDRTGSGSSLAANSTRLDDDTKTFQAKYQSGSWSGELRAYSIDADGALSKELWEAGDLLTTRTTSRNIYVNDDNTLSAFTWGNLSSQQQTYLGSEDVLNYLRGDRSNERPAGTLRARASVLGDIVNSTPVYVGAPNTKLYAGAKFSGASSYSTFANNQKSRIPVVYVGANDGMLHAFNATTGEEIFAFIPNTVLTNLEQYSDADYEHRYFVDGEIAVAEIYDSNSWKTVLVGTLGRGGPGIFALDVTDPSNVKFLWEKSGSESGFSGKLGKNIGKPVIAQVADGDWRVLLGNGPESNSDSAQLIMIRLSDGDVNAIDVGVTGGNGLTAVLARDSDSDGLSDAAYAGDLKGNLWKFTGLSGTSSTIKLFEARGPSPTANVQPITAAPVAAKDPSTGKVWIFFGTGSYLNESDLSEQSVQSWYGLKDEGKLISRNDLVERSILKEVTVSGTTVRTVEEGTADEIKGKDGWYMDLVSPANGKEGERMVVPNRFQGSVLVGTTRIPDASNLCQPSGRGFVMAINPFTGSRLVTTFFDVNGDGVFDNKDMVCDSSGCVPASGLGFNSGPNNPIFIEDVMQVALDDGTAKTIKTQGSAVQATRMSWRELFN